jgi:hypothetical protein
VSLSSTETCIGDEEGNRCYSVIESEDSSIEDLEERKAFACPYFRLDPIRHIECLSRKLYRIQDVKQHLSRRHYDKRDKMSNTSDNTKGVNSRTQRVLKLRLDRRLSPERQWHEIWRTLFDKAVPREGPYLGNTKEEVVGSMIAICKKGSSRVVPGILRSLGLPNEKGKAVQQLMEQLFIGFQALSDRESQDTGTEKTSTYDMGSIPGTPKSMDFDFTLPLLQSPVSNGQVDFAAEDSTERLECSPGSEIQAWSPDHASFEGSGENDVAQYEPLKYSTAVQPQTVPGSSKTLHCSQTSHVPADRGRWKPLGSWITELDDEQDSHLWEYARGWKCHECGFDYVFRPFGVTSDKMCINYPCQHQFREDCCLVYKVLVRRGV